MKHKVKILLIARAGLWRNSFETFLRSFSNFEVRVTNETLGGLIQKGELRYEDIILYEAAYSGENLKEDLAMLLKAKRPETFVVIADNSAQAKIVAEAGAGEVWMKSMLFELFHGEVLIGSKTNIYPS